MSAPAKLQVVLMIGGALAAAISSTSTVAFAPSTAQAAVKPPPALVDGWPPIGHNEWLAAAEHAPWNRTHDRGGSMTLLAGNQPALPPPSRIKPGVFPSAGSNFAGSGRTLRVCPPDRLRSDCQYQSMADALAAASPGDDVVLAPGLYREGAVIKTSGLRLRGEPGAHLQGHAVKGKAALVVQADGVVIDGIECSQITVADQNGACIRFEGNDLTVLNVYFHDNEEGILSGPASGVIRIENCLFERNGFGGQAHGVYVNRDIEALIFRGNRILATKGSGHGLKSRAQRTLVENNVIAGLDGQDSHAIDLPHGGEVLIRNNVLQKGPNSENWSMIGLEMAGEPHPDNETLIEGNLIIFDAVGHGLVQGVAQAMGLLPAQGTVLLSKSTGKVTLRDNTIVGAREIGSGVIERDNRIYQSRREAGLPPYPALPEAVQ
jgi:Right handed beta helix region